jgi:hypothetical protein
MTIDEIRVSNGFPHSDPDGPYVWFASLSEERQNSVSHACVIILKQDTNRIYGIDPNISSTVFLPLSFTD